MTDPSSGGDWEGECDREASGSAREPISGGETSAVRWLIESRIRRNGMACGVIAAEDVRATPGGGSSVALVGTSAFWRLAGDPA